MTLSAQERKRGLGALLVFTFFMVTGFTVVMPLIAVHFVNNLGWAAASVGLALAVRQLLQQGLAIVAGPLTDMVGARGLLCGGVLLRACGFGSLAWAETPALLTLALIISALGGAMFEVPYQASIVLLTSEEERPRYYALSNLVSGVATTLGPLLGVWLLRYDFQLVSLVAALCFLMTFVIAVVTIPAIPRADEPRPLGFGVKLVLRDRPFVLLTALLMGYWFVAMQINISLPILVERVSGGTEAVGVMFALNAGMTVALQYPLIRLLERHLAVRTILAAGVGLMALGIGMLALASSLAAVFACIGLFAFGALLTRPTQQTLTAGLANPAAMGSYLGVSALALALGGGAGNAAGGWLLDSAARTGLGWLPWAVFATCGLLTALGLGLLPLGAPRTAPAPVQPPASEEEGEPALGAS